MDIRTALPTLRRGALAAVALAFLGGGAHAQPLDTIAEEAFMIDMTTHTVLFEKNPDERMPTSSMSKMMTAYVIYEALAAGTITLDTKFPVSEKAWRMEGSKMFVALGDSIRVEDLLRGLLIQSGNDAAVVLAEGLAGSESAFVQRMNEMAAKLGMTNSHFANASGWPDPNHYSTPRDLATLAERIITDFPQYYRYESELEFTWNGIKQGNRNPLLYRDMGVDGIKTGHTDDAGYGLTASGVRDGRRLILVVNGLPSMQARADEPARLLEWGWSSFRDFHLFRAGEAVADIPVWFGDVDHVTATVAEDVLVTLPPDALQTLHVVARTQQPVEAPIAKGATLGQITIDTPAGTVRTVDLVASQDVAEASFFRGLVLKAQALAGM